MAKMIDNYITRTVRSGHNCAKPAPVEPEAQEPAPATPAEMLDAVNNAIMAIMVGGQSYKIGSRMLTRADLNQLYKIRNDLTAQIASQNNTGFFDDCYVGIFDGR